MAKMSKVKIDIAILEIFRKKKAYTKRELYDALNISINTGTKIYYGSPVVLFVIKKIARAIKIPVSRLILEWEENEDDK